MIKKLKLLTIAVALIFAVAGPADAREFASFDLLVEQLNPAISGNDFWGAHPAHAQIKKKMDHVDSFGLRAWT